MDTWRGLPGGIHIAGSRVNGGAADTRPRASAVKRGGVRLDARDGPKLVADTGIGSRGGAEEAEEGSNLCDLRVSA